MNKMTKHKNINIIETPFKNETEINKKTLCICGKLGTFDCLFKACKNCCNSECCIKHNQKEMKLKEIKPKECIFCDVNTLFNVNDNIYFCKKCYKNNSGLIDNITPKSFMFEVDEISRCICFSPATNDCIFKACRDCCPSKNCDRHNKEIKTLGLNCCSICDKVTTQLNSFKIKMTNQIVHYCKKCYGNNRELINNLINMSAKPEEILKFKVKMVETEDEKNIKEKVEQEKKEYNALKTEVEKHEIITQKIINQLRKLPNFCPHEIAQLNKKYECPCCNIIKNFEDVEKCTKCKKFICSVNCVEFKLRLCSKRNCGNCKRGICINNKMEKYCKKCFVDTNKEFYTRHKNKVLTSESIKKDNINLDEFSESKYTLNYKCPLCDNICIFNNDHISKCDKCNIYMCDNCGVNKYSSCNLSFCPFCITGICPNGEHYFYCDTCASDMGLFDDNDNSQKEEEDKPLRCNSPVELAENKVEECNICYMNKKKYACIPCGHLCMCGECANKVENKCPMCNIEITDIIKIFT